MRMKQLLTSFVVGASAAMAFSTAFAADMTDAFDFTQTPRPFVPFTAKYSKSYFLDEPDSDELQPVDRE